MNEERREKLTPNHQRRLDEVGQDPAEIVDLAASLLSDVAYATTIINPVTARALATLDTDVALSVDDEEAGEVMYTNAAVQTVTMKTSIIAPLVRWLADSRDSRVKSNYERRSQEAGYHRFNHFAKLPNRLTWQETEVPWPQKANRPVSPLEIHLSDSGSRVDLTPYQIQACGIVELVRACGNVIGNCDGDWLANEFMKLVILLSGECDRGANRQLGAEQVAGGFLRRAQEPETEEWEHLSGQDQLLAVTVLGAWIRMARLGVPLFTHQNLEDWDKFFNGVLYGSDHFLTGRIWDRKRQVKRVFEVSSPWIADAEAPWLRESSGSPVIAYGIAGELLKLAIAKVQIVGLVPDDFSVGGQPVEEKHDNSDKILVQLKRHYQDIAGCSLGSVVSADITQE